MASKQHEEAEWNDPAFTERKSAEFNELMSNTLFKGSRDLPKQAASQVVDFMFSMMKETERQLGAELEKLAPGDKWMRARLRAIVATGILGSAAASAMGALEASGVDSVALLALMFSAQGEPIFPGKEPPEAKARLEELGLAMTALAVSRAEAREEQAQANKPICEG